MHRLITVSPLGELQMATQGCYMAEGLKRANSQPFSFIHTAEKEKPLCMHAQYQKSPVTKQNDKKISSAISHNVSFFSHFD